jgi:hypothetical protein
LAASGALFCWLLTYGFLGVALRATNRPQSALHYLADSSYWVYLVHLPIIGLIQVDLHVLAISSSLKFLIALSLTMVLALASYQVMVRHTFLGVWLHGRRDRGTSYKIHLLTPRRRRSVVLAALLLGCALTSISCAPSSREREAEALAALRKLSAVIDRDPDEKGGLVGKVDLTDRQFSDADVHALRGLAGLHHLVLRRTSITDAGLAQFASIARLRTLDLDETGVSNDGLSHLAALRSLRGLFLAGTKITDEGLAALGGLNKLQELGLRGTGITDAGLAYLSGLADLRVLDLRGTRVTGSNVAALKRLPRLQRIWLSPPMLTDARAQELRVALPDLNILR